MNFLEVIPLDAVASIMWPLCRVGGCLMAMFITGGNSVPPMVRALMALTLTVCILPSIPAVSTQNLAPFSGSGILTTINEVIIGVAIGIMTQYLAQTFVIAGQVVAMQTGLGFASLVDPVSGTNAPVVGQFFTILSSLVFLAVDGHLVFINMLVMSFEFLPVSWSGFDAIHINALIFFGANMFLCALSMAISAICVMLVVNFTFGIMTRAAPQLNVFSMGFAVSMVVGLFVLVSSLNSFMGNFNIVLNLIIESTCNLIGTDCTGPY